jgi:hypothetical protein
MKPIDDLLPFILPKASGCAIPLARQKIIETIQDMCEKTRIWKYRITDVPVLDGETPLTPPADTFVYEIQGIRIQDGFNLDPISTQDLDEKSPDWRNWTNGSPKYFMEETINNVTIVPFDENLLADITVYLKPADGALQVEDFFIDQYSKLIANGALSHLLMNKREPFYDPDEAVFFKTRYDEKIRGMISYNLKNKSRAPVRTKPTYF